MNKILFIISLVVLLLPVFAQEGLRPLGGRINSLQLEDKAKNPVTQNSSSRTTTTSLLQIPFFDDFYYATYTIYPNPGLWSDNYAYVNTGSPIAPPSIGVATLDGLNQHGYPYRPTILNFNASDDADTLTSQPIDLHVVAATTQTLQPSDSVALSFYYQARGNGETPEEDDSLLLDFYKPNQNKWITVWGIPGNVSSNTDDTTFHRAFVWVQDTLEIATHPGIHDTSYLAAGFKFRFRNKATTIGDFDHWHIDYVYLDKNRSILDTVFNDLTIETVPTPYLRNYSTMPFKQFVASEMASKTSVRIRNNSLSPINMTYKNDIFTFPNHVLLSNYDGGSNILAAYTSTGLSTYANHSNPAITYTFNGGNPMSDYTHYEIRHYVYRSQNASSDFSIPNDTVIQFQNFGNYYALDDGSAEAGYYVNGQGGKMAVRIGVNVKDTLEALQIYFDPSGYGYSNLDTITYRFTLNIWAAGSNGPASTPLYTDSYTRHAQYGTQDFKTPWTYTLRVPQILAAGVYYVGIQQKVSTGIAVGYDVNTDRRNNVYFDSGSGWTQSGYSGSPMIHAVFGSQSSHVGIQENKADKTFFIVYPNPSSGDFIISASQLEATSYQLMNSLGQIVQQEFITQQEQLVNANSLKDGIYFLIIKNNTRLLQQQKIIIQH